MAGGGDGGGAGAGAVCPVYGAGGASVCGAACTILADLRAVAGEILGLFDCAVREAAVPHTPCALAVALGGGVPDTGLALVYVGAAVVGGAGAVAVLGTLDTPADGGVASRDGACAVAVSGAGGTGTAQAERGDNRKLTSTAAVRAESGVGACFV